MAVTIGAAVVWEPGSAALRSIEEAFRCAAGRGGSGFLVAPGPNVRFAGWRSRADGATSRPTCSSTPADRPTVVCDARIDNATTLARQLGLPDAAPAADLLAHGYRRWGDRLPDRLYGDFAAMVWDPVARVLHLFRDHIGSRPLYFAERPGRWLVACSDIGFLLDHGIARRDVDEVSMARYACFTEVDDRRTCFADVTRVPSATIVSASSGGLRTRRHWHLEPGEQLRLPSRRDYLDRFDDVFTRAVVRRLGAGPVGAHLSGGLDSTGIATVASEQLATAGDPLITGSLTSHPSERGAHPTELPWITSALDWLDVEAHVVVDAGPLGLTDEVLAGRPTSLPCGPGEVVLRRLFAARGVRTVLSGWGGDEVVTARLSLDDLVRDRCWRSARRDSRDRRAGGLPALVRAAVPGARRRAARPDLRALGLAHAEAVGAWLRLVGVSAEMSSRMLRPRRPEGGMPTDHRDAMGRRLEQGHLQRRIEEWAEAHHGYGMECRYPLLDRELLELAVSMPADQLRWDGRDRSLMRDGLAGRMSEAVRSRTDKTGAVSDQAARWDAWIGGYQAAGREWADSALVRRFIDPDRLLAAARDMVAVSAGRRPAPPAPIGPMVRPTVTRLMSLAAFLAAVERGQVVDVTDRRTVSSPSGLR